MKIRNPPAPEKSELNMTSMIDIVFLLLIFFVMTFKVVELEGDFSIKMPLAGTSNSTIDPTDLPLKLRLLADDTGNLAGMKLNDIQMGTGTAGFDKLRTTIVGQIASAGPVAEEAGEGPEVEIDTDYNLRYEYVIRAITAVSGYKDGNQVVKLIEKIKFAKPRR
ncbi:ExbD/TolR family protein [Allorhodopirellula heiligendammensis]|uniref:Biopolymer transport protein ExbD/TolR n=1 Tax=Allorhodopirellula heiligendammensis TaxID=2714739 RepID=A0A5C6BXI5_9BACT|nr:biopolymer transporter ExbD [Allorhodopirellula heiligendammensis]TWU17003.1 Biopolymer transport protein ExbD/TolR [Allorhodopirellula heiligendammensis]|tara:strand:+ start:618 stop:1109 length:492 start_codon:yes stop_codon:yes gene_type:complete